MKTIVRFQNLTSPRRPAPLKIISPDLTLSILLRKLIYASSLIDFERALRLVFTKIYHVYIVIDTQDDVPLELSKHSRSPNQREKQKRFSTISHFDTALLSELGG